MRVIKVPEGQSFRSRLYALDACSQAKAWVGKKSLRSAWRTCERGDWMAWLATRVDISSAILVQEMCDCVQIVGKDTWYKSPKVRRLVADLRRRPKSVTRDRIEMLGKLYDRPHSAHNHAAACILVHVWDMLLPSALVLRAMDAHYAVADMIYFQEALGGWSRSIVRAMVANILRRDISFCVLEKAVRECETKMLLGPGGS